MSHTVANSTAATRRPALPTNIECPLASLGRNSSNVMETLPSYHHPLSPSPLDPQVYQMSRKSPDLSTDADDIIYSASQQGDIDEIDGLQADHQHQQQQQHGNVTLHDRFQLPNSSSQSSLEQSPPLPIQQKAATFELRGRNGLNSSMFTAHSSASVGRYRQAKPTAHAQQRHFLGLDDRVQCRRQDIGGYMHHANAGDTTTEDSSDTAGSGAQHKSSHQHQHPHQHQHTHAHNQPQRLQRHHGGRCSVPTVSNGGNAAQYYLDQKLEALCLGTAMRSLPLGSEASHFQNERYFLEDGMRNYSSGNERLSDTLLLQHRASSPSETSGSDGYLLNRTNSPANAFSLNNHLDTFSSSTNTNTSNSNLALDQHQRFHQSKGKSLSDGLSNLGRFSPSLDQGYATLVTPSPTGHNPNTITTHSIVHTHPSVKTNGNTTLTAVTRVRPPPPWNKKGPFRTGPLFDRLGDELVVKIFTWLDSSELCNVARVCRRFEQIAWRPILWRVISLKGEQLNGDKALKMIFRQLCGQSRNGACPEVERVMLADGCSISDKGLQLLTRRCPELTHLQLQTCPSITQQALAEALTKCANLQHLDVTGCLQIVSINPNPNMEPPRRLLLQYLDLTDCMALDDVGLKIVVKNCPQLVYLYLRRCIQITDAGLKFVPSFCISLKELSVSDCVNITDFGLYELAKLGAALRYLSVAKCDRVSDAGLKVIARRCYKLRYLNTRGCEAVSDDSITVLARSCPRLRALDIGKCDVSDAGLRALAESCPNLKKLSLRNCDMITDRGVQCIAYYCRGLQQLNIQDCQISIEGYRAVKKYCKRCIIEHTNPGFC